jgi:diguanylate cyclase (GGDEF)-like protein
MSNNQLNFFEIEKNLITEAKELIKDKKYDEEILIQKFSGVLWQFEKILKEVEKIIRISDGQQEYLHRIQSDLQKEIEDKIRAEEKLKYHAAIDSLTGCYNRWMGLTFLEKELTSIKRNLSCFTICYIDVNGLKYVNDNFGHCEGDELLVMVCRFIKNVIRENDILCRLGGDEFVIIFPNKSEKNVQDIIKEITYNIDLDNKKQLRKYNISFSYGIVQINCDSDASIDHILQTADLRMYEYKKKYRSVNKCGCR